MKPFWLVKDSTPLGCEGPHHRPQWDHVERQHRWTPVAPSLQKHRYDKSTRRHWLHILTSLKPKGRDQLRWGACGCAICARQRGHSRNRQENNEISKRRRDPWKKCVPWIGHRIGRFFLPGDPSHGLLSSLRAERSRYGYMSTVPCPRAFSVPSRFHYRLSQRACLYIMGN